MEEPCLVVAPLGGGIKWSNPKCHLTLVSESASISSKRVFRLLSGSQREREREVGGRARGQDNRPRRKKKKKFQNTGRRRRRPMGHQEVCGSIS